MRGLSGADVLSGGLGADYFVYTTPNDGEDHILDFNTSSDGDVVDIAALAFGGGLSPGGDASLVFGTSGDDLFGSAAERFHFNSNTHTLWYDSNGNDAGGTLVALAVLENGGTIDGTQIHLV